MKPTGVVALYSSCLTAFLAVAGALTFQAGQPQAALALFAAAVCAFLSTIVTTLVVGRANATHARAQADYVQRYGDEPQNERP